MGTSSTSKQSTTGKSSLVFLDIFIKTSILFQTNDIWSSGKTASPGVDPWLPSAGASGFGPRPDSAQKELNTILGNNEWGTRTKSSSGTSSSSIEGWLQNVQPPAPGAIPVLPAKVNNDTSEAWLSKPPAVAPLASSNTNDPWNNSNKPQQVPADPWDPSSAKKGGDLSLDPWAPVSTLTFYDKRTNLYYFFFSVGWSSSSNI